MTLRELVRAISGVFTKLMLEGTLSTANAVLGVATGVVGYVASLVTGVRRAAVVGLAVVLGRLATGLALVWGGATSTGGSSVV